MNIETKIKNIRFIGELCKFKIAPAGLVFSCLKVCSKQLTDKFGLYPSSSYYGDISISVSL